MERSISRSDRVPVFEVIAPSSNAASPSGPRTIEIRTKRVYAALASILWSCDCQVIGTPKLNGPRRPTPIDSYENPGLGRSFVQNTGTLPRDQGLRLA